MAITTVPALGTRVRGEWTHDTDEDVWENVTGTVVPFREAFESEFADDPHSLEYALWLIDMGLTDGAVAVKVESIERGPKLFADDEEEITEDDLSQTYAHFAFENVTIIE